MAPPLKINTNDSNNKIWETLHKSWDEPQHKIGETKYSCEANKKLWENPAIVHYRFRTHSAAEKVLN